MTSLARWPESDELGFTWGRHEAADRSFNSRRFHPNGLAKTGVRKRELEPGEERVAAAARARLDPGPLPLEQDASGGEA